MRCKRQLHEGVAPVEVPDVVVLGLLRLVVEVADDSALMVDAVRLVLVKDFSDPVGPSVAFRFLPSPFWPTSVTPYCSGSSNSRS